MKVALISPPIDTFEGRQRSGSRGAFPLGLGYIAACLRRAGHSALICAPDASRTSMDENWAAIDAFGPDLVGVTAVTPNFMKARRVVAEAKRRYGRPVLMGGPHANALPRSTLLGLPELDAVICGEGELPMLALAADFDRTGAVNLKALAGAAWLENGEFRQNPPGEAIDDLDSLPAPALDLLHGGAWQRHAATGRGVDNAFVISSRGCPGKCTFCVNNRLGRRFRARSPENFVAEVEELVKRYGARRLSFVDDCFTADPRRAWEICDLLVKKNLDLTWDAAGRVNTLTDERLVAKLRQAGCVLLTIGVETGNQRISDLMKKNATPAQAVRCCALLRKYGIAFMAGFMIGNEGETRATALETLDFAIKLKPSMPAFNITVPFPGTELFDRFYMDYDRPDTDWTHWAAAGPSRPYEMRHAGMTMKELWRLLVWCHLRYYAHPLRLLRMLADLNGTAR